MIEPKRLSHGDDLGASLLASARGDQPRAGSRARTAAALGLGAAVGAAAIASAGAAKAAAGASIAPKAIGATAKVATALWLKLLAAGVVTAAVAGAVAVKVERSSHHADATVAEQSLAPVNAPPRAPAPVVPPAPVAPVNAAPEAPTTAEAPVATPVATPTASPLAEPAKSPPRPAQPTASSPPESPLAQELRSLDEARSALARGDPSGALTLLDRHDRGFPTGPLRTEAKMLRVEALLARGDRASAKRLATELLARDPSSPHARRLRTIADGAP